MYIDYSSWTEEDVKNKVIVPLLRDYVYPYAVRELEKRGIGINKLNRFKRFDDVVSYEKTITTGRTDIFILGGMIIIEIKKPSEEPSRYKGQLEKYTQPNTTYAMLTNGKKWIIYKCVNGKIIEHKTLLSDKLLQLNFREADNVIKELVPIFIKTLSRALEFYSKVTPDAFMQVFAQISKYLEDLKQIYSSIRNRYGAMFKVYESLIKRVTGGSGEINVEDLYIRHTLMQMIINAVYWKVVGRSYANAMKYLEPVGMPGITLPYLTWYWQYWENMCSDEGNEEYCGLLREIAEAIVRRVELFDWEAEVDIDVFREFYEKFIEQEDRRKIGEYYTPWWLAEFVVEKVAEKIGGLKNKLVADIACGSGTFLVAAFYKKIDEGESPEKAIGEIFGFDINPIAVSIARLELIIAYKRKKDLSSRTVLTPYIFWGDTLYSGLPVQYIRRNYSKEESDIVSTLDDTIKQLVMNTAFNESTINLLRKLLALESELQERFKNIAMNLKQKQKTSNIEKVLTELKKYSNIYGDLVRIIVNEKVIRLIIELIEKYGDGIWAGLVTSMIATALIRYGGGVFDAVIGNPPWITMAGLSQRGRISGIAESSWGKEIINSMKRIYGKRIKELTGGIKTTGYDLASLFLHVALSWTKKGGCSGLCHALHISN